MASKKGKKFTVRVLFLIRGIQLVEGHTNSTTTIDTM